MVNLSSMPDMPQARKHTTPKCPTCGQPQKPVITNKKGEPYEVTWHTHQFAFVFHPNELEYYQVVVDSLGNLTCQGKSNLDRCWPFSNSATCVHCEAVENSILLGERPAPIIAPMHVLTTPTEVLVGRVTTLDLDDDPLVRLFTANGR